ncbi:hypothetical protein [Bradyrhizobium sp. RT4b]|uniref:hypothetical protein n=1 Tax=Bradyrhizobium sp. RT4b TaxID=3156379 RepID=UPI003395582F
MEHGARDGDSLDVFEHHSMYDEQTLPLRDQFGPEVSMKKSLGQCARASEVQAILTANGASRQAGVVVLPEARGIGTRAIMRAEQIGAGLPRTPSQRCAAGLCLAYSRQRAESVRSGAPQGRQNSAPFRQPAAG